MIEGCPSRTALGAATRRAAHQVLDRPLILDDPLALRILPPEAVTRVQREAAGSPSLHSSPHLRAFLAARARLAEDSFDLAFDRGVRQCVILGAGLDTFAYRSRDRFPGLRIFEVDHPATQAWKRERLAAGEIPIPDFLSFVPVDFGSQHLEVQLAQAGFDRKSPASFVWLGVTMYLVEADVMATLRYVATCAPGSEVVFDYMVPISHLPFLARWRAWRSARRVARGGEPWLSRLDPATLAEALHGMGFAGVGDYGPDQLYARFFAGRADGLRSGISGHVIVAEVAPIGSPSQDGP